MPATTSWTQSFEFSRSPMPACRVQVCVCV